MSIYDIRNGVLAESVAALRALRNDIGSAVEIKEANSRIALERAIHGAVKTDLASRFAAPKLAVIEARMIEASAYRKGRVSAQPGSPGQQREGQ